MEVISRSVVLVSVSMLRQQGPPANFPAERADENLPTRILQGVHIFKTFLVVVFG